MGWSVIRWPFRFKTPVNCLLLQRHHYERHFGGVVGLLTRKHELIASLLSKECVLWSLCTTTKLSKRTDATITKFPIEISNAFHDLIFRFWKPCCITHHVLDTQQQIMCDFRPPRPNHLSDPVPFASIYLTRTHDNMTNYIPRHPTIRLCERTLTPQKFLSFRI